MKTKICIAQRLLALMGLLLSLLYAGCIGGSGGGGSFQGAGVLRGFVTEVEAAGQVFQGGVEGVSVTVQGTDLEATTADDGFFILSGVPQEAILTFAFLDTRATLNVTVPENTEVDLKRVRIRAGEVNTDNIEVTQLPPPVQAQPGPGADDDDSAEPGNSDPDRDGNRPSSNRPDTDEDGEDDDIGPSGSGGSMEDPDESEEPDEPEEPDEDLEAEGPVQSVGSNSIRVQGKTFQVTGSTVILDEDENAIPLSALQPGQDVEMKGKLVGGKALATLIKRRD